MPEKSKTPKIAIVADWLVAMGGAERVVLAMHEAFPDAPIYTSAYDAETMPLFDGADIRTTWIQKFPRVLRRLYKWFPVVRVWAFRSLDLSEYDIILTSTIAESKHVRKTRADQTLITYYHTPVRYYWSHYEEYKKNPGFGKLDWLIRILIPIFMPYQKKLDYLAAQKVDVSIANSTEVQARIKKYYDKPSTVLHPPVDAERFEAYAMPLAHRRGYVALGRQVNYKRIDLAVKVCTALKLPLTVIGRGPEHKALVAMAGPTVEFVTDADDDRVAQLMGSAKGFIFPAEEDFGIVQVEALAAGTPVIAYGKGGSLDIVQDGVNGLLFRNQSVISLMNALEQAEKTVFKPATVQRAAKRFNKTLFISKLQKIVGDHIN